MTAGDGCGEALQVSRQSDKYLVAVQMAVKVVGLLEGIDIRDQDGEIFAAGRGLQAAIDLGQRAPVTDAGEGSRVARPSSC